MRAARSRPALPIAATLLLIAATAPQALAAGITRAHARSDFWTTAGDDLKTANSKTTHAIDSTWDGLLHDLGIRHSSKHNAAATTATTATTTTTGTAANPALVPWLIDLVDQETAKGSPTLKSGHWSAYRATTATATSPAVAALQTLSTAAPSAPTPSTPAANAPLTEAQVIAPPVSPAPVPEPSGLLIAAGLIAGAMTLRRRRRA